MLNHFDVQKLRVLSQVARTQSVSEAAAELRVTPSAVSQTLKSLERTLRRQLFVRTGKRLTPTPLTLTLVEKSERFFGELAETLGENVDKPAPIRLAAPPVFGATVLVELLTAAARDTRYAVTLLDTKRIVEEILASRVDLGLVDDGPFLKRYPELHVEPFWTEQLVLCCSAAFHRQCLREDASLNRLKSLPHVTYNFEKEGVYKWYLHHFGRVPKVPVPLAIDHPQGVATALSAGWGLGVLPASLARKQKGLRIIDGPRGELTSRICLARAMGRVPTPAEKRLVASLVENKNAAGGAGGV